MNKISLAGLCLLAGLTASAQTSLVKEVERDLKGGAPYSQSIQKLQPAFSNPETKDQAYTYYVAGKGGFDNYDKAKIKLQLNQEMKDDEKKEAGLGLMEGYEFFFKALPLDSLPNEKGKVKPKYSKDMIKLMVAGYGDLRDAGVLLFDTHDYVDAYKAWDLYTTQLPSNPTLLANKLQVDNDTIVAPIIFYQGVAALTIGENDPSKADEYNRKAIEKMKQAAAIKDYKNIDVYRYGVEAARRANDSIAMLEIAQAGYEKYGTEDISFIGQLINERLAAKQYAQCYNMLNEAIAGCNNNEMKSQLNDVLGFVYEQEEKFPEAESAYRKAIELNGSAAKPYFDLGRILYNQALKLDETADEATRASTVNPELLKAAEYFEKAYEINPDEMGQVPGILYRLYYRLGAGYEDKANYYQNL